MYVYQCFTERFVGTDGNLRAGYGIRCFEADKRKVRVILSVSDVSEDGEAVRTLVNKCNAGNLSPIHLQYVIEDEFF